MSLGAKRIFNKDYGGGNRQVLSGSIILDLLNVPLKIMR